MAGSRRSRQKFVRGAVLAAVATAALVLALSPTRALRWLESGSYDARVRWTAQPADADKRIVILDIDNASLAMFKGPGQLGRWPWTRSVWSQILWYLRPGHPRAVLFDSIFGGEESPEVDKTFAEQIRQSGNVVLGYTFSPSAEASGADEELESRNRKLLEREGVQAAPDVIGNRLEGATSLNVPLEPLANAAAGLGHVNAVPDPDGITRRVALAFRYRDRSYPSLSARAADLLAPPGAGPLPFRREGRRAVHGGWSVPVDADGNLLLLWHGDVEKEIYERIPIWQVICSISSKNCDPPTVYYKPEHFSDKVVLIGASAAGSYEFRPTPFGETAPGFSSHVTALDNLLHHEAMRVAPAWFLPLMVIAMAALGAAVLVRIGSAGAALGVMAAALAGYTGLGYFAFGHWHLWLPVVAPASALVVSFAATGGVRFATTGRELRQTRSTLNRYMAPQLVEYVLSNVENVDFAGEKRELTIFFSDVRNFTTLTEKSDPLVLISMLNEYLTEMTDVIFKYDGVVDKFIGDGILAYWGAFTPGNHALQGAQASLEMFERLKEMNARWAGKGWPEIDIGVGLNTGEVIFGNVGAGKKIEFTIIGDPVNLASRLESENKPQKTHIIISEFTLARLGDAAEVRSLGGVKVKGKTVETQIFELTGLRK